MPAPDDSDAVLVRHLRAGRNVEENFRRLFHRYYPAVSAYFVRHGCSIDDARDLAQEVFLGVYSGVHNLRRDEAFPAWLFAMARHVRLRQFARQRKSPVALGAPSAHAPSEDEPDVLESLAAADPDALDQIIEAERIEALREALTELPGRMQDCVRARVVDGLKYREIGERLGISENTVAVHVHRGMNYLKSRVKRLFGDVRMHG